MTTEDGSTTVYPSISARCWSSVAIQIAGNPKAGSVPGMPSISPCARPAFIAMSRVGRTSPVATWAPRSRIAYWLGWSWALS